MSADWIRPNWPAPETVVAVATTRQGGVSQGRFASLNMGFHTHDDDTAVAENRRRVMTHLAVPVEPSWLRQVHGRTVVDAHEVRARIDSGTETTEIVEADASVAFAPGAVCAVMTADCLPVLLCDAPGRCVGAVHAGWRGLAGGILGASVERLSARTNAALLAWLGPAIGPQVYEVGDEVRHAFLALGDEEARCFTPSPQGRWLANLYELARVQLRRAGVDAIYGGEYCTYRDTERFYSYRRDGSSGRMASLIWLRAPSGVSTFS